MIALPELEGAPSSLRDHSNPCVADQLAFSVGEKTVWLGLWPPTVSTSKTLCLTEPTASPAEFVTNSSLLSYEYICTYINLRGGRLGVTTTCEELWPKDKGEGIVCAAVLLGVAYAVELPHLTCSFGRQLLGICCLGVAGYDVVLRHGRASRRVL